MKLQEIPKHGGADALMVIVFLLLSTLYFLSPLREGLVLGGHDTVAGIGQGREQVEYRASHDGETTRWSNAIFSGMPTYQMAPSYGSTDAVARCAGIYALGTGRWFPAISYLFLYLLGFYILLRAFGVRPWVSAAGAVMWAFSSYFLIIIAAGHIWKVLTLAYIPPTIGGLILCFRGRLLWGGAVTALFTAFQVQSNHLQMTYYFLFVMLLLVIAFGVEAGVERRWGRWLKGLGVVVVAGLLGVATNLPNLFHTYQYSQYTMRGPAELTSQASESGEQVAESSKGLDFDYITMWSYTVDESFTFLIPDYKGGGSASILEREGVEELEGYNDFYDCAASTQRAFSENNVRANPPGLSAYWGEQPFTVGPVYVGALVCFLFVLGLFYVRGPVKWALLAATVLSFVFAWGKNIPGVTHWLIDNLPMYAKFRTVSSALVIAEFTMPLLAALCLHEILKKPELFRLGRWKGAEAPLRKLVGLPVAGVLTLGICLAFWWVPSLAGDCISGSDAALFKDLAAWGFPTDFLLRYQNALSSMHHAILSKDALRSTLFILVGVALLWAAAEGKLRGWVACCLVGLVCLVDLWQIDKRYLNEDSFTEEQARLEGFATTPADDYILQDKEYFRVANLGVGNPFNETTNATAYHHKSIGGYHAAKLRRYQDLIDHHLNRELLDFSNAVYEAGGLMVQVNGDSLAPVLNMLNTKYFIFGSGDNALPLLNPYANGNGWFVEDLDFVENADAEIAGLKGLDTKHAAVADKRFEDCLGGSALDSGQVSFLAYEPNELAYEVESEKGGVVVFSEIFYPGWKAEVDGAEAELGRVNYVLRALKVPAGKHKVTMSFKPASVAATNTVGVTALVVVLLLFAAALATEILKHRRSQSPQRKTSATAK